MNVAPYEVIQKVLNYAEVPCRCNVAQSSRDWAQANRDENMWAMSLKAAFPLMFTTSSSKSTSGSAIVRKGAFEPRELKCPLLFSTQLRI